MPKSKSVRVHTAHTITSMLQPCTHFFDVTLQQTDSNLVWFTKDDKNWMLGKVTESVPGLFVFSCPDKLPANVWNGFYIENNELVVQSFMPMTGRAKPDVNCVRSLLVSEGHYLSDKEVSDKVDEFKTLQKTMANEICGFMGGATTDM